jgi:hypothetical protein
MEYIPAFVQGFMTLFFAIATYKVKQYLSDVEKRDAEMQAHIKEERKKIEAARQAVNKGVQALLRDRLLQGYHFFYKRGMVTYGEASSYRNMYEAYHGLGKNGVMDGIYENFKTISVHADAEVYPHEPNVHKNEWERITGSHKWPTDDE